MAAVEARLLLNKFFRRRVNQRREMPSGLFVGGQPVMA